MKQLKSQTDQIYFSPKSKDVDLVRKIYLNGGLLSKTPRNHQPKTINPILKQLNFKNKLSKLRPNMSHEAIAFSQRRNSSKDRSIKREASFKEKEFNDKSNPFKSTKKHLNTTRIYSSTSRLPKMQKIQKSTMLSEISNANIQWQKLKQDKKNHQLGNNCRLVIIQGANQQQNYITINKIDDVMEYLRKEYPKFKYYKCIPSQLTIDYFLMQGGIDGKFLNGQSLYLKPCGTVSNNMEQKQQVGLQSFQILKLIGSGGFSKVFLCRFKQDGRFYAMKVIDKQIIVKNKKKRIIMNERNIMKSASHPFVIQMKFAFQSQKHLVFVMQYCVGGQLFELVKKHRRIQEHMARFYVIEIFLGLSYLHSQKVVYRDIKPQNILLHQNGHVKIADLGLAKPDMFEGELAYSFCGSPQYMSPQMILQVGHAYPVDYYCMGALLYELLTGLPPYYSRDPNEIYQAVLSEELTFPPDMPLTSQCKSLLQGLLCKEPKQRLGSIHGVKEILAHPWFGKNQYKKFTEFQVDPPTKFCSIGKVNIDDYTNEQRNKKEVEEVKKEQNIENKKFKPVMKGFYYDFREKIMGQANDLGQKNQAYEMSARQVSLRTKSSSRKKITQVMSKDSKKQNSRPKQTYVKLQTKAPYLHMTQNPNQKSTLKKLTARGSRNNLFKQKAVGQNSTTIIKNILNSQRF